MSGDTLNPVHETALKRTKLSTFSVFFMIYCLVAGGYFGMEDMVSGTGPGLTILILIFFPFLWSIPQALIASELGSALPVEGGYYKWVQRAFGEFWGFQVGFWRTISCYVDTTLYIILGVSYIDAFIPLGVTGIFIAKLIFIAVFTTINIIGLKEVSRITTILVIFAISTLGVFVYYGITNWTYNPVVPFAAEGQPLMTSLGFGMAFCIWVYSGYESMGTMAGELENPQVIPKATMMTIPVVMIVYILPILFGMASYGNYSEWSVDQGVSFVTIMGSYGIPGLTLIFTMGAIATNFSLYNSYLASASRSFFCISEDRLAPPVISKVNKKFGTPHVAILSMAAVNLFLAQFGFATLVVIDVVLFMFAYFIWFLSAVALRIKEPDLERPFRIPFGTKGMIAMIVAPAVICVTALFTNGINYLIGGLLGLLSGPVMYVIWKKMYGGINNSKTLLKSQRNGVLILTGLIAAGLITGFVLLNNERTAANESFNAVYTGNVAANYENYGSKYIIAEDSFAMDLGDSGGNADTRIWYYYGDVTGDIYLYGSFSDEKAFAAAAFPIYQRFSSAGFSQIDIYSDDFAFTAYDGDVYMNEMEIAAYLMEG